MSDISLNECLLQRTLITTLITRSSLWERFSDIRFRDVAESMDRLFAATSRWCEAIKIHSLVGNRIKFSLSY